MKMVSGITAIKADNHDARLKLTKTSRRCKMAEQFGNVKVTRTEICDVNDLPSEIFEIRELQDHAWVFSGWISVPEGENAHQRAYEKWLDLERELPSGRMN